uniref:Alternative protein RIMS3 n=1 Tax=Homo sapiens TaxID=9606 RepID=L8EAQ2_HUMAN|nr:alternative protein RIMS3 [Homo sapiens]
MELFVIPPPLVRRGSLCIWQRQEWPCSDVGLWAGTVMDDSERLSLYFCSVHSVPLSS